MVPAPHAAVPRRGVLWRRDARGRVLGPARVRDLVHVRDGGPARVVVDLHHRGPRHGRRRLHLVLQ